MKKETKLFTISNYEHDRQYQSLTEPQKNFNTIQRNTQQSVSQIVRRTYSVKNWECSLLFGQKTRQDKTRQGQGFRIVSHLLYPCLQ